MKPSVTVSTGPADLRLPPPLPVWTVWLGPDTCALVSARCWYDAREAGRVALGAATYDGLRVEGRR